MVESGHVLPVGPTTRHGREVDLVAGTGRAQAGAAVLFGPNSWHEREQRETVLEY